MSGAVDFVKSTFFGGAEKEAGQQIQAGSKKARKFQKKLLKRTRKDLDPLINSGRQSFDLQQALSGALGPEAQAEAFANFQEDPGTEFLREQGIRTIDSAGGATGRGGGERLRELTRFGQGLALQDLSSRFNRLGAGTAVGLSAAETLANARSNAASGVSQAIQTGAAGLAEGTVGQAAGARGGIGQIAGGITGGLTGGTTGAISGAFGG